MKKCDFCTQSTPSGKCPWSSIAMREGYCNKAINKMVKALGNHRNKKVK